MKKARMMNKPEDYEKLGLKHGTVEVWEDGRRDNGRAGAFEWWYFDCILDDGTKIVLVFAPKPSERAMNDGDLPFVQMMVTLPDGTSHTERFDYTSDEANFKKDYCDIRIGTHTVSGNLKEYLMKIEPIKGYGAELKFTSLGQSWRPETGYFGFGDQDEQYFTWFCVMPKGKVTGTLTLNGEIKEVNGFGYHDHQWGNIHHASAWNHWIWARQNLGDYNILVFDLVTNKDFGFKHYPIAFIEDKDGNIIFENTENAKFEVFEEYLQEQTQKYYPKSFKYTFENNGKKVEYSLKVKSEIEVVDAYSKSPEQVRAMFDNSGLRPSYVRYEGLGELVMTEVDEQIKRSGNLIYEMMYNGKSYKEHA